MLNLVGKYVIHHMCMCVYTQGVIIEMSVPYIELTSQYKQISTNLGSINLIQWLVYVRCLSVIWRQMTSLWGLCVCL